MSSFLLSLFLSVIAFRLPALPLFDKTVYLSAREPRAEQILLGAAVGPPQKQDVLSLGPRLSSQSAIVVDKESGAVLYEASGRAVRSLASLTKLMTALVFLETNSDLSQKAEMKAEDDREGGQTFIRPGESASLGDYLSASLIGSANNATMVLGRDFVKAMNAKAAALGMNSTVFTDPTGLDVGNIGTARDVVLLLNAAVANERLRALTTASQSIIKVTTADNKEEERIVKNTDQLLGSIIDIVLAKTGYLDEALYNLGAAVKLKNGREILLVVLGAASSEERFQDVKNLAVWTERTYEWR